MARRKRHSCGAWLRGHWQPYSRDRPHAIEVEGEPVVIRGEKFVGIVNYLSVRRLKEAAAASAELRVCS
jgi:hypothetical protein